MDQTRHESSSASSRAPFDITDWGMVLLAAQPGALLQTEALESLCATYWPPLYAYLRGRGYARADAKDLTQEFFARLIEKDFLKDVNRAKGKFRSFLLASLKHFLANEWDKGHAQKRGGKYSFVSLDDEMAETKYQLEATSGDTPESLYDIHWALTVLDQALTKLQTEWNANSKGGEFDELRRFLVNAPIPGEYDQVATRLGKTKDAVAQAVVRLRLQWWRILDKEVARTVTDPAQIQDEVQFIKNVFWRTAGGKSPRSDSDQQGAN
jgi:DNA-directed RNA polymerase specialized sigma24 family protein